MPEGVSAGSPAALSADRSWSNSCVFPIENMRVSNGQAKNAEGQGSPNSPHHIRDEMLLNAASR